MSNYQILKLSKTNCYLFTLEDGYLLVDCGYDHDRHLLSKNLRLIDVRYDQIHYLLLTHHHDDHSGLTNFLVSENPDMQVVMHESGKELIKAGENNRAPGGGWCSPGTKVVANLYKRINKKWTLDFPPYNIRENDRLISSEQDDWLRSIGLNARFVFTPGHTPDSISILDDEGNLFCGDSACNFLKWTGTKYAAPYISDLKEYYESWEKMIRRDVKQIYPSHGAPFPISKISRNIYKITELTEFVWD